MRALITIRQASLADIESIRKVLRSMKMVESDLEEPSDSPDVMAVSPQDVNRHELFVAI